jgi:hypothetical protein
VADFAEHLQIVVLIADGDALLQGDSQASCEPADAYPFRDAHSQKLQEARVAESDRGSSGEMGPGFVQHIKGVLS